VYAPEHHEEHTLSSREGMRLVCVFNPPLQGHENHDPTGAEPSGY
jgi:L-ectoine synthase